MTRRKPFDDIHSSSLLMPLSSVHPKLHEACSRALLHGNGNSDDSVNAPSPHWSMALTLLSPSPGKDGNGNGAIQLEHISGLWDLLCFQESFSIRLVFIVVHEV